MWSYFGNGGESPPHAGRIAGQCNPCTALPIGVLSSCRSSATRAALPTRLVIKVVFAGRGTVYLGPLKIVRIATPGGLNGLRSGRRHRRFDLRTVGGGNWGSCGPGQGPAFRVPCWRRWPSSAWRVWRLAWRPWYWASPTRFTILFCWAESSLRQSVAEIFRASPPLPADRIADDGSHGRRASQSVGAAQQTVTRVGHRSRNIVSWRLILNLGCPVCRCPTMNRAETLSHPTGNLPKSAEC